MYTHTSLFNYFVDGFQTETVTSFLIFRTNWKLIKESQFKKVSGGAGPVAQVAGAPCS